MKPKNIVIAIYNNPEYYPPTLNAIEFLSKKYDNIYVIHRNIEGFDWKYPENVYLFYSGKLVSLNKIKSEHIVSKMLFFFRFTFLFFVKLIKFKPDTIIIYDSVPTLSYRIINIFIKKPRILWYHNHDVSDLDYINKYSLLWFSWKSENWILQKVNLFTIPAMERTFFFNLSKFNENIIFLPNYPSKAVYNNLKVSKKKINSKNINLSYQGVVSEGHGIEEIIQYILTDTSEYKFNLYLKGRVSDSFSKYLVELAKIKKVDNQLFIEGFIPYSKLIYSNNNMHIGIAIYKKDDDIMNRTIATASNKIYEYAASRMPVILFDNEYFRNSFSNRTWTFFTDLNEDSIKICIKNIIDNYESISQLAFEDFKNELCFENYFQNIVEYL